MWSGSKALQNLDQTLKSVRNEVVRLDRELTGVSDQLAAQQRRRLVLAQEIAKVRLKEIETGQLLQSLSSADRQAEALLQQRQQGLNEVDAAVAEINQRIEQAEQDRATLQQERDRLASEITATEATVQQELGKQQEYLAQLAKAEHLRSVADEAAQKVSAAQADMAAKAKPYQDDKLFSYLWQAGFGTTEYEGGLLARQVDGWIARLIGFADARVNYWNLTEIPKRLQQHADQVGREADDALMDLQQLELDALAAADLPALKAQLLNLQESLDQHDDTLEAHEQSLDAQLEQRALYVAGEDPHTKQCVALLSEALAHEDLAGLRRFTQSTQSRQDDDLLPEFSQLQYRETELRAELSDIRSMHDAQVSRLQEIEEVRRNFKDSRFDDVRSAFNNETLIASVLGQFLQGMINGSELWRVLRRNQQYNDIGSRPDFGSGGIGDILGDIARQSQRATRNPTWHWPRPRRGGGGMMFPSGRRSRGGGISRGGSSGGGFKTGGGF